MPKCTICGKKFDSLAALRDHHQAVHRKEKFVAPTVSASKNLLVGLIIVIIVVGGVVGYLIYQQQIVHTQTVSGLLNTLIPTNLYQNLSGVSYSTLNSVGTGQGNTPTSITGSNLTLNGKPEILYIGAEYCPYCAAERWAMIVALSKFGNFSGIEYMQSSSTDVYANTVTFSFVAATYASKFISFVPVEYENRAGQALQTVTPDQQSLWTNYDSSENIPFVDLANQYLVSGAQYATSTLTGYNWTQVASQLNNPSSSFAKAIDGAANTLISAICTIDGGQGPNNICSQSFAKILSFTPTGDSNWSTLTLSMNSAVNQQTEKAIPRLAKSLL